MSTAALAPKFESVTAEIDGKGALEVKVHASGVKRYVKYHLTGKATTLYTNVLASSITSAVANYISKEISYAIDSVLSTSSSTKHIVHGLLRATLPGVTIGNPRNLAWVKYDGLVVKDETNGIEFSLAPVERDFRAIVAAPAVPVAPAAAPTAPAAAAAVAVEAAPAVKEVSVPLEVKEVKEPEEVKKVEEVKEVKEAVVEPSVAVATPVTPNSPVAVEVSAPIVPTAAAPAEEKSIALASAEAPLVKALHNMGGSTKAIRTPLVRQMGKITPVVKPVVAPVVQKALAAAKIPITVPKIAASSITLPTQPKISLTNTAAADAITAAMERAKAITPLLQKAQANALAIKPAPALQKSLQKSLLSNVSAFAATTAPPPRPVARVPLRPPQPRAVVRPPVATAPAPAPAPAPVAVATPVAAPVAVKSVELADPKLDDKDHSIILDIGNLAGIDRIVLNVGSK